MVYTEAGLPIYSKCYGTFCKTAFKNPELLSGFLSALQTLPLTMSPEMSLDSVKMGPTEMRFSRTTPTHHTIVVGLGEDSADLANKIFDAVAGVLAMDKFVSLDWTMISSDMMNDFKEELLKTALVDALHEHGGFEDKCELGDQCPLHTTAFQNTTRRSKVWSIVKDKYAAMRARMSAG